MNWLDSVLGVPKTVAGWLCGLACLIPLTLITLAVAASAHRRYRRLTSGHPWHTLRAKLGRGFPVADLARRLDLAEDQLRAAQPRYSPREIPKRSGGTRRLLVPDPATKDLQRRILHRLLRRLRAHPAACGFERGRSIVDNAAPHAGRAVIVKLDIVGFFPATKAERVERYFRRVGWNAEAAALLTRLCTHEGG